MRNNPDHQDSPAIARSVADFSRVVAIGDRELAKVGRLHLWAGLYLADIPIGLSIHRCRSLPAEKPWLGNIDRYYDRLCERAAFRQYGRGGGW